MGRVVVGMAALVVLRIRTSARWRRGVIDVPDGRRGVHRRRRRGHDVGVLLVAGDVGAGSA